MVHIRNCIYHYFIPLYGWIYMATCLSIYRFIDLWMVSTLGLLWIVQLWICLYMYLIKNLLLILLSIYEGVELLGYMVILCLTFWGAPKLFSTAAKPIDIPTCNVRESQRIHILANTSFLIFGRGGGHSLKQQGFVIPSGYGPAGQ